MQNYHPNVLTPNSVCQHSNLSSEDNKQRISFNIQGHDPFIDFLKGLCILMVILTHCIPEKWNAYSLFVLWGRPAVPLFLLIQVFHTYKKGLNEVSFSPSKIWNRIFKPFAITEIIIITFQIIIMIMKGNLNIIQILKDLVHNGGYGPGSYYPYIYIQMALLLPCFTNILKKWNITKSIIFFIIFSQGYELACCLIGIPEWIYRLLVFRYIFIIPIGYILATKGLIINNTTITLSIISAVFLLFFRYSSIDLYPYFYQTISWKTCHWICYIFMCYLLLFLVQQGYKKAVRHHISLAFLTKLGQYSYEIFLFQMFYFAIIHGRLMYWVSIITNNHARGTLGIIIAMTLCTIPIVWYKMKIKK